MATITTIHTGTNPTDSIELQHSLPQHAPLSKQPSHASVDRNQQGSHERRIQSQIDLPPPNTAPVEQLQKWNEPRINMWRVLACCLGLFIMGANDAAYGVGVYELEV